ncbi:hypothetical protein PF010_g12881 [Phytophthora fragariae]|nr:hypothetical protein PF011_g28618 [Phytophthora fragariae]KAE9071083.1 hypothetical protein PF006_g29228 [Phytophthora fragariae]KAE9105736.1 hypothetical protein PF010_g12881 [Phytophthora fragariae]
MTEKSLGSGGPACPTKGYSSHLIRESASSSASLPMNFFALVLVVVAAQSEYCDSSMGECRAASNATECYNATIALFQDGCDPGYDCIDDLCRVSADPVDGRTCHIICSAGRFCENDTTECREPAYDGECFNLATGLFQDGCDEGFYCSYNKCVDVSLDE